MSLSPPHRVLWSQAETLNYSEKGEQSVSAGSTHMSSLYANVARALFNTMQWQREFRSGIDAHNLKGNLTVSMWPSQIQQVCSVDYKRKGNPIYSWFDSYLNFISVKECMPTSIQPIISFWVIVWAYCKHDIHISETWVSAQGSCKSNPAESRHLVTKVRSLSNV